MSTLLCFVTLNSIAATGVIKTHPPQEGGSNFAFYILQEIVKRNPQYQLSVTKTDSNTVVTTMEKTLQDFESGRIDVFWTLSDANYEKRYQAIHYPLYLGLFGLRLAIVEKEKSDIFKNVHTLADLRQFKAGQGKSWADTEILKSNGIPVIPVTKYFSHFPMLEGDRFDYFPRAIHEPWNEVRREAEFNLTVDSYIALKYKVPFYMFVLKDNKAVYQYLVDGMEELTQSGRHRQMFFAQPDVQEALQKSNLKQRTIIELDNPQLSQEAPVNRAELWFDPLKDEIPLSN